jgi:hypothetical protein
MYTPFAIDMKPSLGVFKSIDGGEYWAPANVGLEKTTKNIPCIAVHPRDPNTVYIGTAHDGVYKSIDGGQSWIPKSNGLVSAEVRSICINPQNPDVLYVGLGSGVGICKSTNAGELWGPINEGLELVCPPYLSSIGKVQIGIHLEKPPTFFPRTEYTTATWTSIRALAMDPADPETLFCGDINSGVYVSYDGGGHWNVFNVGLANRQINALAFSPDGTILYAGTQGEGVYRLDIQQPFVSLTIGTMPGGTTTPRPGTYKYPPGSTVALNAIPGDGFIFSSWTGHVPAGHEKDNPITITMNSDKSITANFTLNTYMISGTVSEDGTTLKGVVIYGLPGDPATDASGNYSATVDYGWSGIVTPTLNCYTFTPASTTYTNVTSNQTTNYAALRIIYPPLQLSGQRVLNRSLSQAEYINMLTWNPNPNNENIVKYRVYLIEGNSPSLLAEVNSSTYKFQHREVDKNKVYTYSVLAVNNENREGNPAYVTIR